MWLWLKHWALISLAKAKYLQNLSILFSFNEFEFLHFQAVASHVLFIFLTFQQRPDAFESEGLFEVLLGHDFSTFLSNGRKKNCQADRKYQVGDVSVLLMFVVF